MQRCSHGNLPEASANGNIPTKGEHLWAPIYQEIHRIFITKGSEGVTRAAVCHAKLSPGHLVQFPPIRERFVCLKSPAVCNISIATWAAVCHATLLQVHVVQFSPIRAENVFNDITIAPGSQGHTYVLRGTLKPNDTHLFTSCSINTILYNASHG